jgi:hypothetical protein
MRTFFKLMSAVLFLIVFAGNVGRAQTVYNLVMLLNGGNQNPSVSTNGYGVGWGVLDLTQHTLRYAVAYDMLSGPPTGAHFHLGVNGVNGPVIHDIGSTFDANGVADGEWTDIPDTTLAHILRGRVYCNIHTSANPGGEIRGQLVYEGPLIFPFLALGSNENPPTGENGKTVGFATLSSGTLSVTGIFKGLTGTPTGLHIHYGATGENGAIAIPLSSALSLVTGSGLMPNDSAYRKLLNGEMYFNIHTATHPGGELRGQLMGLQFYPFWASLDGGQSVPSNSSDGKGIFVLRYDAENNKLDYGSQILGIPNLTGAHIHIGAAGENGGVAIPLSYSATGFTTAGDQKITPADSVVRSLCKTETYVNVHTSAFPAGEIRGQLVPAETPTTIAFLDSSEQVPVSNSSGTGVAYFMFPGTDQTMNFGLLVDGLTGPASAAHIHTGIPGQNGSVVIPLAVDTIGGEVPDVSDAMMVQLLRGGMNYVNVHTAAYPGGEIRGDIQPIDGSGGGSGVNVVRPKTTGEVPQKYSLNQNYPNPFNPTTQITYDLPTASYVTLKVYDILGNELSTVVNELQNAGEHTVTFSANGENAPTLSSGMYFYRITSGNFVQTKKMLLLK